VKTSRTGLSIALVAFTIAAVIGLVDGRPEDAIVPGLSVVVVGVVVYQQWRRPLPPPKAWTRRRTTVAILVMVPVSIVTLGMFAWVAIKASWPNWAVGLVGFVFVVAMLVWLVVTARREDRLARQATGRGTPTGWCAVGEQTFERALWPVLNEAIIRKFIAARVSSPTPTATSVSAWPNRPVSHITLAACAMRRVVLRAEVKDLRCWMVTAVR
jgi:hypothetical protein